MQKGVLVDRRELIKSVLNGQRTHRLPRALFGGGRWFWKQTGQIPEDIETDPAGFAEKLAALYHELDTDIVFAGSGMNSFPAEAIGGELAFKEGQAPLLAHPIIEKTEDARYLDHVDIALSPHSLALIAMIVDLRKRLPDRYLCVTSWGPFTWGMILCEWNMLQERTTHDPEFIREVCSLGVRLSLALFKPLIEMGSVDGVVISDGAATLVPLDLYREVVLSSERRVFEQIKPGIARFLHQCGAIAPQFSLYPDSGADCISIDAGVRLADAYRLFNPRAVTAGNLDVIKNVFGGDPGTMCGAVADSVDGIPELFTKFILMPSCDLPPDTPLPNVRAFLACADRLGH